LSLRQTLVLLFLNILFLSIPDLNGQSVSDSSEYVVDIDHFTTLDGLSNRSVKCMFQDRDDMIWIGTENGLNRFDGYHFKHWLGKNHGVDLRFILDIIQDDEGWLWILTDKTVLFFNPKTEEFQTIIEIFGKDCILLNKHFYWHLSTQKFITDKQGRIFFYTYINGLEDRGLYSYFSTEGFREIKTPPILDNKYFWIGHISDSGEFHFTYQETDSKYYDIVFSLVKDSLVFLRDRNTNTEFPFVDIQNHRNNQD
jgi:ligand-binding sensor domain-containing protein